MRNTNIPGVDVCGNRTLDYVIESVAKFNRSDDGNILMRAVGSNISRGVGVSRILAEAFGIRQKSTKIYPVQICGTHSSCMEMELEADSISANAALRDYSPDDSFVEFPIYNLLLDAWLARVGKVDVVARGKPLTSIRSLDGDFDSQIAKTEIDPDSASSITAAYSRCGLLASPDWHVVGNVLSGFDDVIVGVDTNILLDAAVTEQIISSLFLIDPREYLHTPNWLLIVIPSAVIHELEQAANSRDSRGLLTLPGRMGFRALEEILELNRNADFAGVSLTIAGDADPVLDTRVELRGLREDFYERGRPAAESGDYRRMMRTPKKSSGDMMIRAQYKEFLRKIDFHKGVFFLTADKSNAALARAERLHAIYYKNPSRLQPGQSVKVRTEPLGPGLRPIALSVPLGKFLYELAVQFGQVEISSSEGTIEIECDQKGESLDRWLLRQLRIQKDSQLTQLLENYISMGGVPLRHVMDAWKNITESLFGSETVMGWTRPVERQVDLRVAAASS